MAGTSGGWGGARPGAGRKPKARPAPEAVAATAAPEPKPKPRKRTRAAAPPATRDMLELLQGVALGTIQATPLQVRAAIAAVQYTHTKRHDGGKKDEQGAQAERVAGGRFAPAAPPKLAAVK